MGRILLFPLLLQNGCSQSSRFLPQARRILGSGDENDQTSDWFISVDFQSYRNTEVTILLLGVFFERLMLAFGPVRKELNDRTFNCFRRVTV